MDKVDLGTAPITVSLFSPPLKIITVGILRMPYSVAIAGHSSVLIFKHLSLPPYSFASWSIIGAIMRHGPHQGAQKSTRTGISLSNTRDFHVASVTTPATATTKRRKKKEKQRIQHSDSRPKNPGLCTRSKDRKKYWGYSLLQDWEEGINTSCLCQGFLRFAHDVWRAERPSRSRADGHRGGSGPPPCHRKPRTSRQSRSSSSAALSCSRRRHTRHRCRLRRY